MDFRLADDQRALQDAMFALIAAHFPRDRLRALVDGPARPADAVGRDGTDGTGGAGGAGDTGGSGVPGSPGGHGSPGAASAGPDPGLWRALGDAGFFALRLPEKSGGTGLGLPDAVLLFEAAGRALLPGPLVATHLAAGLVPGAAEGTRTVTALSGPGPAEHLASADAVLLLDGPVARVLHTEPGQAPHALHARPFRSVDPTTPLHHVDELPPPRRTAPPGRASSVPPLPGTVSVGPAPAVLASAGPVDLPAEAARLSREAVLLTAAQQLGGARATLDLAVAHARRRVQFGRPIGAFQAVQHLCARMLVRADLARASLYAASLTETPAEIAGAKLLADRAAIRNARDCLQVHGGLGFTWETDIHLHLKRAWVRAEQWQSTEESEELLANELLMNGAEENAPDVWRGVLGSENTPP
ncbi:acyl-CoA dehydrogenase family protein [Streptomyces sp. UNOC14_S4]|uniref:acyl-CoA dehydrogenase family protein n=1 Tax=Streptomyces sp. UNOC14_S4 TaxID=2872340 RepID=UPI001E481E5C|nr:acyl-CoA dehydrogenase family protein [Streptomyces sp. UNOC14_S4]MCC3770983.1 acyl-CoA/acyl-ACP dehydrogenase [Streptomyces sp. UNOC14_S4]